MKRFVMAIALSCVLSATALADGDIPSGGFKAPPPPPDGMIAAPAPGEIWTSGLAQEVSEVALDLFQFVFGAVM